jgi:hypothetical protein
MGQDDPLGQGLDVLQEPLGAGRGLDDDLERSQGGEGGIDACRVGTQEATGLEHSSLPVDQSTQTISFTRYTEQLDRWA